METQDFADFMLQYCVESSCASALIEGDEHCSGCSRLLQLYQFSDNIVIEVDGRHVLKLGDFKL